MRDIEFTKELTLSEHEKTNHKVEGFDMDIIAKETSSTSHDCNAEFTNETNLINHEKEISGNDCTDLSIIDPDDITLMCNQCVVEFTDIPSLGNHKKNKHKDGIEVAFKCPL